MFNINKNKKKFWLIILIIVAIIFIAGFLFFTFNSKFKTWINKNILNENITVYAVDNEPQLILSLENKKLSFSIVNTSADFYVLNDSCSSVSFFYGSINSVPDTVIESGFGLYRNSEHITAVRQYFVFLSGSDPGVFIDSYDLSAIIGGCVYYVELRCSIGGIQYTWVSNFVVIPLDSSGVVNYDYIYDFSDGTDEIMFKDIVIGPCKNYILDDYVYISIFYLGNKQYKVLITIDSITNEYFFNYYIEFYIYIKKGAKQLSFFSTSLVISLPDFPLKNLKSDQPINGLIARLPVNAVKNGRLISWNYNGAVLFYRIVYYDEKRDERFIDVDKETTSCDISSLSLYFDSTGVSYPVEIRACYDEDGKSIVRSDKLYFYGILITFEYLDIYGWLVFSRLSFFDDEIINIVYPQIPIPPLGFTFSEWQLIDNVTYRAIYNIDSYLIITGNLEPKYYGSLGYEEVLFSLILNLDFGVSTYYPYKVTIDIIKNGILIHTYLDSFIPGMKPYWVNLFSVYGPVRENFGDYLFRVNLYFYDEFVCSRDFDFNYIKPLMPFSLLSMPTVLKDNELYRRVIFEVPNIGVLRYEVTYKNGFSTYMPDKVNFISTVTGKNYYMDFLLSVELISLKIVSSTESYADRIVNFKDYISTVKLSTPTVIEYTSSKLNWIEVNNIDFYNVIYSQSNLNKNFQTKDIYVTYARDYKFVIVNNDTEHYLGDYIKILSIQAISPDLLLYADSDIVLVEGYIDLIEDSNPLKDAGNFFQSIWNFFTNIGSWFKKSWSWIKWVLIGIVGIFAFIILYWIFSKIYGLFIGIKRSADKSFKGKRKKKRYYK